MRSLALAMAGGLFAAACTGSGTSLPSGSASSRAESTSGPTGLSVVSFSPRAHCHPARPSGTSPNGLVEVRGIAQDGQLWALVFDRVPVPIGRKVKIAWRMTGAGPLRLLTLGEHEQVVRPHDLIRHGGSNWDRPGAEWGGYFVFPSAGCWDIQATRGSVTGDVWLVAR
jgi:hypothetical protein